ncbi:Uncharacterised protein [Vibrio cholerae]|nr:Uncharacterised protein [Vibrio cholerae]CRZ83982.1 Uncharacterised protein [Vibrio cholerae]CSA47602.1 Uncharacterised protein [Vibrio cholerae]CSA74096.1 Uncharacterised protein [Vibrio cholerae]CSB88308.1 Uncharacterised protein [Vibrio cholerae]
MGDIDAVFGLGTMILHLINQLMSRVSMARNPLSGALDSVGGLRYGLDVAVLCRQRLMHFLRRQMQLIGQFTQWTRRVHHSTENGTNPSGSHF